MAAHRCRKYLNACGEVIDPADQGGIGCPVCYPPDGRVQPIHVLHDVVLVSVELTSHPFPGHEFTVVRP